ncbi:MAG TPA: tetratricopeptide repeat protein, partial [Candidatus Acidoferrum sp.]|nr:tetratricopeptide repeat protein [Candidatus Acidoferrum sp.]
AVQDEVTINILSNLQAMLLYGGRGMDARFAKYYSSKHGLDCYVKVTEADESNNRWNIADNTRARQLAEEAMALCPENPLEYSVLGWVYHHAYMLGNTTAPRETFEKSLHLVQKALAMDDSNSMAHSLLGVLASRQGNHAKAIAEGQRAMALNPGNVFRLLNLASTLTNAGRPEDAIPVFQQAIRLPLFGPSSLYREYGRALRNTGRFEEAVSAYQKALQIAPENVTAHVGLTATYGLMGRAWEARAEAAQVLRSNPTFSLDYSTKTGAATNQAATNGVVDALRLAGLK